MNIKTKGCFVIVVLCILLLISTAFIINNIFSKSFQIDKTRVDDSWNRYVNVLNNRNKILLENRDLKNIVPLINETEKKLKENLKEGLIENEFKLNDSIRKYKLAYSFNKKLNDCLIRYNSNVREFNTKYSSFPYNYVRIKKSVSLYDYFDIIYGIDNNEKIKKNKKINEWIEKGGDLKIE